MIQSKICTAELGKKGDEAGAEAETDYEVRSNVRRAGAAISEEDYRDADEAQPCDKEP